MTEFWLGTHHPHWLWHEWPDGLRVDVPLFVSRRTLGAFKRPRPSRVAWALDSGGFSEITIHGRYTVTSAEYAAEVRRFADEIGQLRWAAIMDHMCEPVALAKTGATVEEHQRRTIASCLDLRAIAPDLPWVPVLQGWTPDDYWRHVEMYDRAGVDLAAEPLVGIGSVCRRQDTRPVEELIRDLADTGLRLHGFGFKIEGLRRAGRSLASADSLAWSYAARRRAPLSECRGRHASCANCPRFALLWRERVRGVLDRARFAPVQGDLFGREAAA